jgi:transposase
MLKLFAILALLSQPAMAQDSKQEFEADAQACDKAADFAKCFERDRMQRALTDHATKLVIEELGRRLDRIEKRRTRSSNTFPSHRRVEQSRGANHDSHREVAEVAAQTK